MKNFESLVVKSLILKGINGGNGPEPEGDTTETCKGTTSWHGYGIGQRADQEKDGDWYPNC